MPGPTPLSYFLYPFCINGTSDTDIQTIANTGSDAGIVNYQYGWTPDYELPSDNDANKPVPRQQMNQVFFDITSALQQLQKQGFPLWISTANGGPANYPIYAQVAYDSGSGVNLYYSVIASNTSVPGADGNWVIFSGNQLGVQAGTTIDFAGPFAPAGYLLCDASAKLRASYPNLFSAITQIQSSTTVNTSTTLTVVSNAQMYVGMAIEGAGIPASTTLTVVNYLTPTVVTMSHSATNSATVPVRFFTWGAGDGSTTFNLPPSARLTVIGSGGSPGLSVGGVPGVVVGQSGGVETVTLDISQMPAHDHPGSTTNLALGRPQNTGSGAGIVANGPYPVTVAPQGGGGSHNNMQPSVIMNRCIKT
jgi:microcystin-dependent protein